MLGGQETLDVLVDEEEPRELGVARRHGDEPRQAQGQREAHTRQEVHAAPDRVVARRE
jgi:hypothetical protein